ncbi:chemotaxis protein MotB [Oceaniovalibus guishaninsula JLT2003]|uniref:Chemotaxis protein MotB n=1 Tax=Oceaniovalibus guishaninsula JLT2003 TaxID=1231392 RepID=K2HPA9_9RHOB|nr:flagellar motor protein MotB [Oceaniovalibus guishaninsula]EKE44704.1 chemotaxis protein MotB [Oceaniovalibus guishaninsula JLT2003]
MTTRSNAPVIIKRKKVIAGGGHHGGAWKVAYADFVTAMMAFFMLMWLLNATTETQRKGIADYFSPSIPVARVSGGGDGALSGHTAFAEIKAAHAGRIGEKQVPDPGVSGDDALADIEDRLKAMSGESMAADDLLRHIVTRVTDEGLIVTLMSLPDEPLFDGRTVEPTQLLKDLVDVVGQVFAMARNGLAVEGHLRAAPVVLRDNPVWDISVARAGAVRDLITERDVSESRIVRMTGHGDRMPWQDDPMDMRNDRIELILLRTPDTSRIR